MEPYDVTDEVVLAATPEAVYRAVVDEHDARTDWWAPHYTMRLRSGDSYDEIGTLLDNTVRVHGKYPIKFVTRTVAVEPNRSIRVEYVGGAFRGEATWRFEPEGEHTRLSLHWRTTPAGALRVLSRILPVAKSHSDTTEVGFANLADFLARR